MKQMSEVFELPVGKVRMGSDTSLRDQSQFLVDVDSGERQEHAAHAINMFDPLAGHLDNALNYIYQLESLLDESGIDLSDIDTGVLSQHCLDYQSACDTSRKARGE